MTAWGASKGEVPPLVAKMAGGRKKRILTEEQRARLIEAGKTGRDALKRWRDQRAQGQDSTQYEAIPIQVGEIDRSGRAKLDIGPVHLGQGDYPRILTV